MTFYCRSTSQATPISSTRMGNTVNVTDSDVTFCIATGDGEVVGPNTVKAEAGTIHVEIDAENLSKGNDDRILLCNKNRFLF